MQLLYKMTGMLQGKVIVVIGGTSGIGISACREFIHQGARVVATGIGESATSVSLGESGRVLECDATVEGTTELAIGTALQAFGRFDGLYHVAGGSGRRMGDGPLHEMTLEGWRATMDLNLMSVMLSNRAAIREFISKGRGGVILNLGSVLASSPSPRFFATHAYAAAKSAITGFSLSIAAYYASSNIRVNVLSPGLVDTPMATRAANDPSILSWVGTKQPLDGGRIGKPGDLDGLAVFLFSDKAGFITGQEIKADGGWSVSEGQHK
jgi:NAD(P)-dependent dehydrogenase (short-subunit alcohol dehydrogenase family)